MEQFFTMLDNVFSLMLENKLRKDIDDTLFEKLLSIIEDGRISCLKDSSNVGDNIQNDSEDFFELLLNRTEALRLIEKCIVSLQLVNKSLSASTQVFAIKLFGLIFKKENLFVSHQNSPLLQSFSCVCNSDTSVFTSSVQNAILTSLSNIVQHVKGTLWILEESLTDFVFSSFASNSFYVRKSAVIFFTIFFKLWTPPTPLVLYENQKNLLDEHIKKIIKDIISGFLFYEDAQEQQIFDCCISSVKESWESTNFRNLLSKDYFVIEKVSECLRGLRNEESEKSRKLTELLLVMYSSDPEVESVIKDIIQLQVQQENITSAMQFTSAFLRISEKYKPITESSVIFLMMPLAVSSSYTEISLEKNFHIDLNLVCNIVVKKTNDRLERQLLMSSSLTALSKLTEYMDIQALGKVLSTVNFIIQEPLPYKEGHHQWYLHILEDRKIKLCILDLFESYLSAKVYTTITLEVIIILFESLLYILEQPSSDSNNISEVLRLFNNMLILNSKNGFMLPDELKEKLLMSLTRKLLSNKESVIDNSLHIIENIIDKIDNEDWHKVVCKLGIHNIMWDMAIIGNMDGPIKSSALCVIIKACQKEIFWEDIKSSKCVNETSIVKILCNFVHDPDFYIQREALSSLFQWVKFKWNLLQDICKDKFFFALAYAIKSLDLEMKLNALNAWHWFIELQTGFSHSATCDDLEKYMNFLSNCGFGSSMIFALQDYDEAVKFKSASVIFDFKKRLKALNFSKDCLTFKDEAENDVFKADKMLDSSFKHVSEDERDLIINNIIKLSTSEQIANICRTSEISNTCDFEQQNFPHVDPKIIKCSVNSLWTCLWSEKVESLHCFSGRTFKSGLDYSISVLEDIIAAEETDILHPSDDTPDCY